jgi:predicted nucleic acid-binding protein
VSDRQALVLDASVAVKWHLNDESDADAAALLLARFSTGDVPLIAPDHIRYEIANAFGGDHRPQSSTDVR